MKSEIASNQFVLLHCTMFLYNDMHLWHCMRETGVSEKYVKLVQDMYAGNEAVIRCTAGVTEAFSVKVSLHQGSTLSPLLFSIVMDTLVKGVQKELPWNILYADDVVLMGERRENVEEDLERWRYALERRGMKISQSKTEYLCENEMDTGQRLTMKLQDVELPKAQDFKYLGSTVQKDGGCEKEVKKRIQAG